MSSFLDLLRASWSGQPVDPYSPFAAPQVAGSKGATPSVPSADPLSASNTDDQTQPWPPAFLGLPAPLQPGQQFAPIMPTQAQRGPDPWLVAAPQASVSEAASPSVAPSGPPGGWPDANDRKQPSPKTYWDLLPATQLGQSFAPIMPTQAQGGADPWLVAMPQAGGSKAAAPAMVPWEDNAQPSAQGALASPARTVFGHKVLNPALMDQPWGGTPAVTPMWENKLFGLNGQKRYQFFPERLVRGLAQSVYNLMTTDPMDPYTGKFREEAIANSTNIASMFTGAPAGLRPGVATLGSGAVRGTRSALPEAAEAAAERAAAPSVTDAVRSAEQPVAAPAAQNAAAKAASVVQPAAKRASVLEGANYTQRDYSPTFSRKGTFKGRSVNDVANDLRSGKLTPDDVPINYIVRDGNTLIMNTRSAQALERAGFSRDQWRPVNVTGNRLWERGLDEHLKSSGLSSRGIATVVERKPR